MRFQLAPAIASTRTKDLKRLARTAGADPRTFYSDADFNGVDVTGQDLRGIDLSTTSLNGVIADENTVVDNQYAASVRSAAAETATITYHLASSRGDTTLSGKAGVTAVGLLLQLGNISESIDLVSMLVADKQATLPNNSNCIMLSKQLPTNIVDHFIDKWFSQRGHDRSSVLAVKALLKRRRRSFSNRVLEWVSRTRRLSPLAIVHLLEGGNLQWARKIIEAWGWTEESRRNYMHLVDLQILVCGAFGTWSTDDSRRMMDELAAPSKGGFEVSLLAFELAAYPTWEQSSDGIIAMIRRSDAIIRAFSEQIEIWYLFRLLQLWFNRGMAYGYEYDRSHINALLEVTRTHRGTAIVAHRRLSSVSTWKAIGGAGG